MWAHGTNVCKGIRCFRVYNIRFVLTLTFIRCFRLKPTGWKMIPWGIYFIRDQSSRRCKSKFSNQLSSFLTPMCVSCYTMCAVCARY